MHPITAKNQLLRVLVVDLERHYSRQRAQTRGLAGVAFEGSGLAQKQATKRKICPRPARLTSGMRSPKELSICIHVDQAKLLRQRE